MNIHQHYKKLWVAEREFTDEVFGKALYARAYAIGFHLPSDDRMERAVDAFAQMLIESRRKIRFHPGIKGSDFE